MVDKLPLPLPSRFYDEDGNLVFAIKTDAEEVDDAE